MKISKIYRKNNWFKSFIPTIVGFLCFWAYYYSIPLNWDLMKLVVLFLITSIGFAALGYLINDFFDKEDDNKSSKFNYLSKLSSIKITILFLATAILAIVPWFFLPFNFFTLILLATQFFLYFLYNVSPFRFKKNPFLSVFIDLSYAYLIPFILSLHTVLLFVHKAFEMDVLIVLFFILLFTVGFLNILTHQKEDAHFDIKTNSKTLPIYLEKRKTHQLTQLLTLLQNSFFLAIVVLLFSLNKWFLSLSFLFFTHSYILYKKNKSTTQSGNPLLINKFLQIYLPILLLILLSAKNIYSLVFLPIHIFLFTDKKAREDLFFINKIFYSLKFIVYETFFCNYLRPLLSKVSNQLIYRFFLVFNVNLKNENKSAWAYVKEKFGV